jgi:Holliday junction resolvasome RuvABC endonuclease subunit
LVTLTLDPGFSACGWGIVIRERGVDTVVEMNVVRTKKASKKARILVNEDNFLRGRAIAGKLIELINYYGVDVLTFEALSMPMKASRQNLVKIGMAYAILMGIATAFDLAVVMSTPQQIKKKMCGQIKASKEEVRDAVSPMYDNHPGVITFMDEVPESIREHGWDALAAYVTAEDSDVMKALKTRA